MLDAFVKQTYGSIEAAAQADHHADQRIALAKEVAKALEKKAITKMCTPSSIVEHMAK